MTDRSGTAKELERIASNQQELLEAMPEMVLLINATGSVEFNNASAINYFGDICNQSKENIADVAKTHKRLWALVENSQSQEITTNITTGKINGLHIEYSVASFSGYRGDDLYWLIIRDISENLRRQDLLNRQNKNIDSVLAYKIDELKESAQIRKELTKQLKKLKNHLHLKVSDGSMVGSSRAMCELHDMTTRVAKSDATVLITGESGTGKELVANLIRETSNRKDKPFLKVNCNTISDMLLESDLFGYDKGAFTGANTTKKGKFEVVDGGTILLDEIGDISPRMQGTLLRVLQDGEIFRVGGNSPIKVDVRIITATNIDLMEAVQKGSFRLDLFYRLNIINLKIPPLREHKEDILDLVIHFGNMYRKAFGKDVMLTPDLLMRKLLDHNWPGNIRELENVIQRAVLMCKTDVITEQDLDFDTVAEQEDPLSLPAIIKTFNSSPLKSIIGEVEKEVITQKLRSQNGNVSLTAKALEISKAALYGKLKQYDISAKELR